MTEQLMVKQERAVRTRDALIRSAAEVFDREGFALASLTSISSLAGVSKGALHHHFVNKAALTDAVEEAALTRLLSVAGVVPPRGVSRVQLLVDVTHRLARALREDVVLRVGFELSGEVSRPVRVDLREWWRRWVGEKVLQAEGDGELRPGVTASDAVNAVVSATVGLEVLGARDAEWLSGATITRFWLLLLPAVVSDGLLADLKAEGAWCGGVVAP
ncbi:ScbR family autoregulator-binding transcription factor [Streptomyces sp. SCSIO 30461]|uniref:ScbR family autoregulator-binding transcription factor n=1 Tax=Streptomyces sp. SCSIO 30461 TaxID=3118085 RepID=UPI0030CB9F52